jgi:hypothetical protein
MDPKTKELVDAAEQRAAKARNGPFGVRVDKNEQPNLFSDDGEWIALFPHQCVESLRLQAHADANFIAHARADVPALCAAVYVLENENLELKTRLAKLEKAARRAYDFYSCDDACECDDCEIWGELIALLEKERVCRTCQGDGRLATATENPCWDCEGRGTK